MSCNISFDYVPYNMSPILETRMFLSFLDKSFYSKKQRYKSITTYLSNFAYDMQEHHTLHVRIAYIFAF